MARSIPSKPLIAIIGATGTGKSQLAVEIAKRYDGEIINGDAMQLYAGLPIITNKITIEEQQDIPHHLLGCIGLYEQTWVVGTFVKKAQTVIDEIRSRGKLPILVGGTHYYTQSLLLKDRLAEADSEAEDRKAFLVDPKEEWPILQQPTEVLLDELKIVDPIMAQRWHPNDRRKIQRSLEIYLQTGKKASEVYADQRKASADMAVNGAASLRYPTLMLWVHAEHDVLRDRLDRRVDKMIEQGLLREVETLQSLANVECERGRPVDQSRGIWVSIGYKEFKDYIQAVKSGQVDESELLKLRKDAVERAQAATRQYAKRQLRWIRIKLLNALVQAQADEFLYLLDGTDSTRFAESVVSPALTLVQSFLTSPEALPRPPSLSDTAATMLTPQRDYDLAATPEQWMRKYCEHCGTTCVTDEQWQKHVKSKSHRKLKSKAKSEMEHKNSWHTGD